MLSSLFVATVLAAVAARADPNPSEPGPGAVYKEGGQCHISWDPDTTGTWTTMNIELMSGSNLQMNHITTVTKVDGTDATKTSFDYPCPEVTPNSAIYFYQFTSPESTLTYWTTRFTIAAADGSTTPPANADQPNPNPGDPPIPWGIGNLVDPSQAVPAPAKGTNVNSTSSAPPATSGSSTPPATAPGSSSVPAGASSPAASSPAGGVSSPGSSKSSSSIVSVPTGKAANGTSTGNTTGAAAANGAAGITLDSRLTQAVATLGVVAAAFAVVF